jgi:hypothetical protein
MKSNFPRLHATCPNEAPEGFNEDLHCEIGDGENSHRRRVKWQTGGAKEGGGGGLCGVIWKKHAFVMKLSGLNKAQGAVYFHKSQTLFLISTSEKRGDRILLEL